MRHDWTCYYNVGILCANGAITNCERCGWYPEVEKKRKAEIRAAEQTRAQTVRRFLAKVREDADG